MKRFSLLGALLLVIGPLMAQVDRSKPPKAGPPPEIDLEKPPSFTLDNGLKTFVVEDHTAPTVSFYLLFDHDPVLEGNSKGYVRMMGQLLEKGTENRSKEEIARSVDMIGASFSTSGNSVYGESLKKHSGELLDIMADVVLNPTFPKEELKKLKRRRKSALKQERSQPAAIASNVRKAVNYGKDHPYGEVETVESVGNIKLEQCKDHYRTYFRPNVAYLAVVGDVTPKEAKKMVKGHFSDWKKKKVPSHDYEDPKAPESPVVALVNKEGAVQSNLNLTYPVEFPPDSKDKLAANLMNSILGGGGFSSRLLKNIREDKGYTYGVFSRLSSDELIGEFRAGGSVATNVTDSAITQFIKEMKKIRKDGITNEELKDHRARTAGGFTLSLEEPRTIARFAINIERYGLPEDYYKNYLKRLDKITVEEVNKMARKYVKPSGSNIVVVGDADSLKEKLQKFGKVVMYDKFGDKKGKEKKVELPEGLTAQKVLDNYISAIGGKKNLKKVKDLHLVYADSIMGRNGQKRELQIEEYKKRPNKHYSGLSMGGMTMQAQAFDGDSARVSQRGMVKTLKGEKMKEAKMNATMFPELKYDDLGVKVELGKGEMVNGKEAVSLRVTYPTGKSKTQYFDLDSWLLLRETSVQEMRNGKKMTQTTDFGEYKEVKGVKFPQMQSMSFGPRTLDAKLKKIEVNKGVKDEQFKF